MIIFVYGEDTYRALGYVRELTDKFKRERDPGGYNLNTLEASKMEAGEILTALSAAPFLADKRMVVINNLLSSSDSNLLKEVGERLKNLPDYMIAVVAQNEAVGKTKAAKELFESLKTEKFSREFALLTGNKLSGYAEDYLKKRGAKAEDGLLDWLTNQINDSWILTSTLDQLISYTAGRTITRADANLFVVEKVDDDIFHLVEAIVSQATPAAFKLLAEQRRQGEDAPRVLALVAWQMRVLLSLADELERRPNESSEVLAKVLKLHPFVVKKNMGLARRVPLAKLQERYKELLSIDWATKTGLADPEVLLDVFVAR